MDVDKIPNNKRSTETPAPPLLQEIPEVLSEPARNDERPRLFDLAAALPNLVLAILYGLTLHRIISLPFLTPRWLGTMMGIEFIVIHSFPFLILFGSLPVPNRKARLVFRTIFWALFALYFFIAFKFSGFAGMLAFASLTVATYCGFLVHRATEERWGRLMIRWFFTFVIFIAAAYIAGVSYNVEAWPGQREALAFGMLNFAMLALVEGLGFYQSEGMRQVMAQFKKG